MVLSGSSPMRTARSTPSSTEVDVAVGQQQPDANGRKGREEVGHDRQHVQPPELQGCGSARALLSVRRTRRWLPARRCRPLRGYGGPPRDRRCRHRVRPSERVVRIRSRVPRRASSSEMRRLSVGTGTRSVRAAADRLPLVDHFPQHGHGFETVRHFSNSRKAHSRSCRPDARDAEGAMSGERDRSRQAAGVHRSGRGQHGNIEEPAYADHELPDRRRRRLRGVLP